MEALNKLDVKGQERNLKTENKKISRLNPESSFLKCPTFCLQFQVILPSTRIPNSPHLHFAL